MPSSLFETLLAQIKENKMKKMIILFTLLTLFACDDKKDDEFSLNGTWLSVLGKMDGSNEPVVFFDTDNKIFTAAYVNPSNTANGCYCYYTFTYEYDGGNKYDTNEGELNINKLDGGNIKVKFAYLGGGKEIEYGKESNNIESGSYTKCSSDCS